MAVVLVMMVIIAGVVYFSVREYMLEEAKERYYGILLKSHEEIRRRLTDVYVATTNNVHDIERDIDFHSNALAEMLGVSQARLNRLFHRQTIHRTPEAYIDNLRTLNALRLLRDEPNYTIAAIAEESGFTNIRMLQRRIQDAIGMSPVEYRLMITRDF
jgi:transcriptional regulator GlxA family with amidase domain